MKIGLLAAFAALAPFAAADIQFTSPTGGEDLKIPTAGTTLTVEWGDSKKAPAISLLKSYVLDLCAGTNNNFIPIKTFTSSGAFAAGNSFSATVLPTDGGDQTNAYFFRIVSTANNGQTITNFSPRFTLSGMTGDWPTSIAADLEEAIADESGPDDINNWSANKAAVASSATPASYLLAYTEQTGVTRYAPMQRVPSTKITKSSASRQYPTSSYSLFTTYGDLPDASTTVTLEQTFSVSSVENTASAAVQPSDDMAKFLARWKD